MLPLDELAGVLEDEPLDPLLDAEPPLPELPEPELEPESPDLALPLAAGVLAAGAVALQARWEVRTVETAALEDDAHRGEELAQPTLAASGIRSAAPSAKVCTASNWWPHAVQAYWYVGTRTPPRLSHWHSRFPSANSA